MANQLLNLLKKVPLPNTWSVPEPFHQICEIDGFQIELLGLTSTEESGVSTFAAAASTLPGQVQIWDRAYFELLERLSVLEAEKKTSSLFEIKNTHLLSLGVMRHDHVFRRSLDPFSWQVSRSNGVAAYLNFTEACQKAAFELWERDAVLRSWYGAFTPVLVDACDYPYQYARAAQHLSARYEFKAFSFLPKTDTAEGFQAAGVFCFPNNAKDPFAYGFGSGVCLNSALEHATGECLQRLGFLWGEDFQDEEVRFAPAPQYHQEIYLRPQGVMKVKRWLEGDLSAAKQIFPQKRSYDLEQLSFIDLTPPWLMGKGHVVKAIDPESLPLVFGTNYQSLLPIAWRHIDIDRLVHPIV